MKKVRIVWYLFYFLSVLEAGIHMYLYLMPIYLNVLYRLIQSEYYNLLPIQLYQHCKGGSEAASDMACMQAV